MANLFILDGQNKFLLPILEYPVFGHVAELSSGLPSEFARCRIRVSGWSYGSRNSLESESGPPLTASYIVPMTASDSGGWEFSMKMPGLASGRYDHWIEVRL